jgi:outer membrane receptor protein involved in Fe transport
VDSVTARADHPLAASLGAATTVSFGDVRVQRYSTPGLGETKIRSRDVSAETVLNWDPGDARRLIAGVSFRHASLDQFIDLSRTTGIGSFDDVQRSFGVFADLTVEPAARTLATVALRYQADHQERTGSMTTRSAILPLEFDGKFKALLPKFSLAYEFSDELRGGLLVQRAYNPGGATLRLDTGALETFDEETLWNFELFGRGTFAGGALTVSGNAFYTSMRDAQRFRIFMVGPVGLAEIFNVPRARSYGAELTADLRATERLSARLGVGLLETKVTRTDSESVTFQGKEFARSPGVSASGSLEWRPLDPLRLSAQVRHHGSYYSEDRESEAHRIGAATFVDARAAYGTGRFTLFGYVRNLLNTFRLRMLFPGATPPTLAIPHDPREFGFGIEATL